MDIETIKKTFTYDDGLVWNIDLKNKIRKGLRVKSRYISFEKERHSVAKIIWALHHNIFPNKIYIKKQNADITIDNITDKRIITRDPTTIKKQSLIGAKNDVAEIMQWIWKDDKEKKRKELMLKNVLDKEHSIHRILRLTIEEWDGMVNGQKSKKN